MPSKKKTSGPVQIPIDLTAADARTTVEDIKQRLEGSPKSLTADLSGRKGDVSISALQLLISLSHTESETTIKFGKRAREAMTGFMQPTVSEATS